MSLIHRLFPCPPPLCHKVPDYIVFSVQNFNSWFCHPDNGAVYANAGIYLRLDKLSSTHIVNYLELCYGIDWGNGNDELYDQTMSFFETVYENWKKQQRDK